MRKMYTIRDKDKYYFGLNQKTSEPYWTSDLGMAHFFFDINYAEGCRDFAYPDCEIIPVYISNINYDKYLDLNKDLTDIMVEMVDSIKDEDIAITVGEYFEKVLKKFAKVIDSKEQGEIK